VGHSGQAGLRAGLVQVASTPSGPCQARTLPPPRTASAAGVLGKGEAKVIQDRLEGGQHVRSYDAVALQLLGWWTLTKSALQLRELIVALYRQVAAVVPAGAIDWRQLVDKHFGKRHPQFSIVAEGPDHSRTFRAILTTDDGRTGDGEAKTKKGAQHAAARDYLQRNAPHLLATTTVPDRTASPRNRLTVAGEDLRLLRHIAAAFGCADLGPFRQALTHRSWVYENMPGGDVERDSNATLAHLGSAVLGACVARARARAILAKTTDPDADLAIVLTLPDRVLVPLFEALGLLRPLRLGAGQRTKPVTVEMAANAVQAVLAASYLQHPDLPTFESDLPDAVTHFLRAQVGRARLDPTTQLQGLGGCPTRRWISVGPP
jgi:dsRNA-specific ribonuclease